MSKTGEVVVEEINKEREEISQWQDIKELDAQIRTIERPTEKDEFFKIEISLFESLGERGMIYIRYYKFIPYLSQLKEDIKEIFEEIKTEIEGEIETGLTGCEEDQLKIIKNLNLNYSAREPEVDSNSVDVCGGNPAAEKKVM